MKYLPAIAALLLVACSPKAPPEEVVRSQFEERIKGDVATITPNVKYPLDIGNGLTAESVLKGEPIYDIKKTDSINIPYEGVAFFPLDLMIKGRVNSGDYSVRVNYVYIDSEWRRTDTNLTLNEKPIFAVGGYDWADKIFEPGLMHEQVR